MHFSLAKMQPLLLILLLLCGCCRSSPSERRLLEDLMYRYTKEERPVVDEEEPVQLSVGLDFRQILDLDEKNQVTRVAVVVNLWQ